MSNSGGLARERRTRLHELYQSILAAGGTIVPISAVDEKLAQRQGAFLLKHDVHDLSLESLIEFASEEIELGIRATYFFLPEDHPRIVKAYGYKEQIDAMRQIEDMGHELAFHVDPYFLMYRENAGLPAAMKDALADFRRNGIELKVGNLHGNSRFKHVDIDGYGTAFDLFREIERQPDFPELANVPEEYAEIIRQNRISLADFGISYWADMPLWSAASGFVGTNYLSDNNLGKKGSVDLLLRAATTGCYYVSKSQPPGFKNLAEHGQTIPIPESRQRFDSNDPEPFDFFGEELEQILSDPGGTQPLLVLIHPEFYC